MPVDDGRSAADWLASAHPRPAEAHRAWKQPGGLAPLPCGVLFTAVRLPALLVHAATGTDDTDTLRIRLGDCLGGPVIHDPARARYYPLVPTDTAKSWRHTVAYIRCLEPEQHLNMPAPTATQPTAQTPYWTVPPAKPHKLCDPEAVKDLTRHGQRQAAAHGAGWCHWHAGYAPATRLVTVTGTSSLDAGGRWACPPCRRAHRLKPFYDRRRN
ncbi:hypothetical protein [Streptomyces sp. NPDC050560]|uniref:hypothetical protein n=1 Tax=Streptomyces sp. NPDC050560 TaxID=3365630 RepID=UPI0037A42FA5